MHDACDGYAYIKELEAGNHKENQNFSDFSAFLEDRARELGVPLDGQFELTPLCNFNCKMCYVTMSQDQLCQPLLTPSQWKNLISDACKAGMLRVTLSGGECLAYPGFKEVFEHLQSLGCEVEIFTNGALLDKDWITYFVRRTVAGIHITLYGDSEEAYERVTGQRSFERVLRNIRAVKDAGLPLRINVTPSKFLGEDVFGTIRLAMEITPHVTVNSGLSAPREETGRIDLNIDLDDETYLRIKKFQNELRGLHIDPCPAHLLPAEGGDQHEGILYGVKCGAGRSGFNVDWKGIMSPCNALEMIKAYPLEDGFDKAWQQIRHAIDQFPRAAACEGCVYEPICEPCIGRKSIYAKAGEWPHVLCERTKHFVECGAYSLPTMENS